MSDLFGYSVLSTIHPKHWIVGGTATIDGSSAVSAQTPTTAVLTFSKPAGTGVYRITPAQNWGRIIYAEACLVKAAGTYDAKIDLVTVHSTTSPFTDYIEFQVRKTSDGTALDPTTISIRFKVEFSNSSESA